MTYRLQNRDLEIQVHDPLEHYNFSRFDWSGKIVAVNYQGISFAMTEHPQGADFNVLGAGFYNEFGMFTPLGFEEATIGEQFHKIGVGLLKKVDNEYHFKKSFQVEPAEFSVSQEEDQLRITCTSQSRQGYAYVLHKTIELLADGFAIHYRLENTGEKDIHTDEYVHNFMAINKASTGSAYEVKFPFDLHPEQFAEIDNAEQKVQIGSRELTFSDTINNEIFFSHLNGNSAVDAQWDLRDLEQKIGIREEGNFQTNKLNLWGQSHVISPEIFIPLDIPAGESKEWSRTYTIFRF